MTDKDELAKRVLGLEAELIELRASVHVLRVCVASVLGEDRPEEMYKLLESWATAFAESDPRRAAKLQAADVIDAVQKLKKRGSSAPDS